VSRVHFTGAEMEPVGTHRSFQVEICPKSNVEKSRVPVGVCKSTLAICIFFSLELPEHHHWFSSGYAEEPFFVFALERCALLKGIASLPRIHDLANGFSLFQRSNYKIDKATSLVMGSKVIYCHFISLCS